MERWGYRGVGIRMRWGWVGISYRQRVGVSGIPDTGSDPPSLLFLLSLCTSISCPLAHLTPPTFLSSCLGPPLSLSSPMSFCLYPGFPRVCLHIYPRFPHVSLYPLYISRSLSPAPSPPFSSPMSLLFLSLSSPHLSLHHWRRLMLHFLTGLQNQRSNGFQTMSKESEKFIYRQVLEFF